MSSLEREMEQTRDRLASAIDELVHRASPKTIAGRQADSAKSFFIDRSGAPRKDNIGKVVGGVVGFVVLLAVIRRLTR